jgi:hypothetical protein
MNPGPKEWQGMRNQRPAAPLAVASISRGTGCRSEASFDMGAMPH